METEKKPPDELAILKRILRAVEPLDYEARIRVIDFARSKLLGAGPVSTP